MAARRQDFLVVGIIDTQNAAQRHGVLSSTEVAALSIAVH
jgi:hypothetical protein